MLGLAMRAGGVAFGTGRVQEAVRRGTVAFAIVATDLTATGRDKLVPLLESRTIPHIARYTRSELGAAIGKAPVTAVGITDPALARRLRSLSVEGARE